MSELTFRQRTTRLTARVVSRVPAPIRAATNRISPLGWTLIVGGMASWLGGWLLGWTELMLVAAGCLVILAISVLFTFGRTELDVAVEVLPQRVTVGEQSAAQMTVTNSARRRMLPVTMELVVGAAAATIEVPSLAAGGSHEELLRLPTRHRAVIPVGPASSVRGDPLGVLRRATTWTDPIPLYVHPLLAPLEQLGAGLIKDLEGQVTNDLSNNDVAFHALREYVQGDDRRFVHWRTSARVGTLMVRQFVDTRRSHLAVVASGERSDFADAEEFELAVSVVASMGARALLDEHEVSMSVAGRMVPTTTGQRMLDALAGVRFGTRSSDLLGQSTALNRRAGDASVVMLVTGSVQPLATIRAAATRWPENARLLVIRAQRHGQSGFRPVGNLTMLHITRLEDLARVLGSVLDA